jgi:hypothetical protein
MHDIADDFKNTTPEETGFQMSYSLRRILEQYVYISGWVS